MMPSGTALLYSIRIEPKLRTTEGSFRTSKRDEMATWSEPRVMTCCVKGVATCQLVMPLLGGEGGTGSGTDER